MTLTDIMMKRFAKMDKSMRRGDLIFSGYISDLAIISNIKPIT